MTFSSLVLKIRPAILAATIKKVLHIKRVDLETPIGKFWIDPASHFGNSLLQDYCYEPKVLDLLLKNLCVNDTFVDLGANEGFYSIAAGKKVGVNGRVISVEPQTRLQNVIARNITANNLTNVLLLQLAISSRPSLVPISLYPDVNSGASSITRRTYYSLRSETVRADTLENVISLLNLKKIDLCKIDIEGFEYEAILSSKRLFEDKIIRRLAVDIHEQHLKERGIDGKDILDFLVSNGYTVVCKDPIFLLSSD